jgi:dolichol-phosphate mannosyltransferase
MEPAISFIIPLYNEKDIFQVLITRLKQFTDKLTTTFEIVLIDDGSSDETPLLMKALALTDKRFHCIFLSRNFGHQYALSAGLKYSRATEAVMILDGDLQDPPELFFEFYPFLNQGFDVVFGVRKNRQENVFKKSGYYIFYRILTRISLTPVAADSGDFALLSRKVVNVINAMPEDSRFLRGMRSWIGFNQKGVEYNREKRVGGEPKYTIKKLIKLAYDGVFNFSSFPIKLLTVLGAICLATAVGYFVVTLVRKIFYDDVPVGFTALLFMIIFFGGIQLLSIGIIGEYVFRTFQQVKNRPLFVIKERVKEGEVIHE